MNFSPSQESLASATGRLKLRGTPVRGVLDSTGTGKRSGRAISLSRSLTNSSSTTIGSAMAVVDRAENRNSKWRINLIGMRLEVNLSVVPSLA